MKSMQEFTNDQLEVMSKESNPRGKAARQELERRAKKEDDKKSEQVSKPAPKKRTRKKPAKVDDTSNKDSEDTEKGE